MIAQTDKKVMYFASDCDHFQSKFKRNEKILSRKIVMK